MENTKISEIPFYEHSFAYAQDHYEIEQYRKSWDANCKASEAFQDIAVKYYDFKHYTFNSKECFDELISKFGYERAKAVVLCTINNISNRWDKRYDVEVYNWAEKEYYSELHNRLFSHIQPGLMNMLAKRFIEKENS